MKKKVIEIRQSANKFAKMLGQKDFTTHPESYVGKYPKRNTNGDWITGLSEDEAETYGKRLKKDLSINSEFWEDLYILLVNRTNKVLFNMDNPLDAVKFKCAIANKYIAPTLEDLKEEDYHKSDCYLYVYDEVGDFERESTLRELRQEAITLIFTMKNQKEKMLYILAKTGSMTNSEWTSGILHKGLSNHLEKITKKEQLTSFIELLKSDNLTLSIEYYVNKAKGKEIKIKDGIFYFGNITFGSRWDDVVKHFKKNEQDFELLVSEFAGKE